MTGFSFRAGKSIFHGLDARVKLVCVFLLSLVSVRTDFSALAIFSLVVIFSFLNTKMPFKLVRKELRGFLFLLFFVFLARSIFAPGTPVFNAGFFSVTREGLMDGALVCWRLLLIVLLGLLFISTTRPSEIRAAVVWFLHPVPFIPAKRVGTMVSLIVRFIPVIFNQAKETIDAQRARGIENRKNPVYRLTRLAVPLVRRTFENADKLALAMTARCFTENRTGYTLSSRKSDWAVFFLVVCLCIMAIWF